jgi:hypothetical protein
MRRAATARPKRSQRLVPRVHRIVDVGRWTILLRFTGHFSKFDNHCYLLTVEIGPDLAAHFHRSRSIARNQETGYAAKPHTPSAYSSLNPGFTSLSMSGGGLSCFVSLVTFPSSIIMAISFCSLGGSDTRHSTGGLLDVTTIEAICQRKICRNLLGASTRTFEPKLNAESLNQDLHAIATRVDELNFIAGLNCRAISIACNMQLVTH